MSCQHCYDAAIKVQEAMSEKHAAELRAKEERIAMLGDAQCWPEVATGRVSDINRRGAK